MEQEGTEWNMSGLDDMEQDGSVCDRIGRDDKGRKELGQDGTDM